MKLEDSIFTVRNCDKHKVSDFKAKTMWKWCTFKMCKIFLSSNTKPKNSPVWERWIFELTGQWWRTHGHGHLSHSRSAIVHNSTSGGERRERWCVEVQRSRRRTYHGWNCEELYRERRHRHHSLMVILHKICLEASVVLGEGDNISPLGQRSVLPRKDCPK